MNNNRNLQYSSLSSINQSTLLTQDPNLLKGIEPLPLIKNGRRDNTITIKKNYKEGYVKKEVPTNMFTGNDIFNNTEHFSQNYFEVKGNKIPYLGSTPDAFNKRGAVRKWAEEIIGQKHKHHNLVPGTNLNADNPMTPEETNSIIAKEAKRYLLQSKRRAKNDLSQRADLEGTLVDAGQKIRGIGGTLKRDAITSVPNQNREFNVDDYLKGNQFYLGPHLDLEDEAKQTGRSQENNIYGHVSNNNSGHIVHHIPNLRETLGGKEDLQNDYIGPAVSVRSLINTESEFQVSRLETELDLTGPVSSNIGVLSTIDTTRNNDRAEHALRNNHSGPVTNKDGGFAVQNDKSLRETFRGKEDLQNDYIGGVNGEISGIVSQTKGTRNHDREYKLRIKQQGPLTHNRGVSMKNNDTRIYDREKALQNVNVGPLGNKDGGVAVQYDKSLRDTFGGTQNNHIIGRHNNTGSILQSEYERKEHQSESFTSLPGPLTNSLGPINETHSTRNYDKASSLYSEYIAPGLNSNTYMKTIKELNPLGSHIMVEDYLSNKGMSSIIDNREQYDNFDPRNMKGDTLNREGIEFRPAQKCFMSNTLGEVELNKNREDEHRERSIDNGDSSKSIGGILLRTRDETRPKNQLQPRLNIHDYKQGYRYVPGRFIPKQSNTP